MAKKDLLDEAAERFLGPGVRYTRAPTSGGVNNKCDYVTTEDGRKFVRLTPTALSPAESIAAVLTLSLLLFHVQVLRVYNNGQNTDRVQFEHAVLQQLSCKAGHLLSFELPVALPAPGADSSGFIKLSSGDSAALFKLIPGVLPKVSCARAMGQACGELTTAMALVDVSPLVSPTAPYWDIYRVHRAVTRDNFHATVARPSFEDPTVREATDYLLGELHRIEASIGAWKSSGLPSQLIHGDAHGDNILVSQHDGVVTGVLDFEFAAMDFRAMELAITLSKYVSLPEPLPFLTEMCRGFAQKARLTDVEIQALPELITLRVVSNAVYFVGRALAGEDSITSLTTRIADYAKRVRWINANGPALINILRQAYVQL
jgi:homoserine kinase type II